MSRSSRSIISIPLRFLLIIGSMLVCAGSMTTTAAFYRSSVVPAFEPGWDMNQTKLHPVAPASFGGQGIIVNVSKSGVKIEYDCADGEITGPLMVDKKGRFKIEGVHKGPTAGPSRADESPKLDPVIYEGQITGKVLRFTVTMVETKARLGKFTAALGRQPLMQRCA